MLANGSTAIERRSTVASTVAAGATPPAPGPASRPSTHQPPPATSTMPANARIPAGQRRERGWAMIDSSSVLEAERSRCTPSGVRSNAQASTRASGKPRMATSAMAVATASGSRRAGTRKSAACITAKATAP